MRNVISVLASTPRSQVNDKRIIYGYIQVYNTLLLNITPSNTVHFQKLTATQLASFPPKNHHAHAVAHWTLPRAGWNQSTSFYLTYLRSVLRLSPHLYLDLPNCRFPFRFSVPIKRPPNMLVIYDELLTLRRTAKLEDHSTCFARSW
jgi:hypothetical protein